MLPMFDACKVILRIYIRSSLLIFIENDIIKQNLEKEYTALIERFIEIAAAFLGYLIGLCFVHIKIGRAVLFSLVVGLLCSAGSYVMGTLDAWIWIEPIWCGIFLAAAMMAKVLFRMRWDDTLLALLLAIGAFAILIIPWYLLWVSSTSIGQYALWLSCGSIAVFIAMFVILRRYFPEKNWQSAFKKKDEKGLKLRRVYMYLMPAFICLFVCVAGLIQLRNDPHVIVFQMILESLIYWLMVIVLILMPAYELK